MQSRTLPPGQLIASYDSLARKSVNQSWEKRPPLRRKIAIKSSASLLIPFAVMFSLLWIVHQVDRPARSVFGNHEGAGHIQHRLNRLKTLNREFSRAQAHSRSIALKRTEEVSGSGILSGQ